MDSKLLVRTAPGTIVHLPELPDTTDVTDLAAQARALLGYGQYTSQLHHVEKDLEHRQKARKVLEELDVRPFDPTSVARYKKRKEWTELDGWQKARERTMIYGCIGALTSLALCVLSLITWGLSFIPALNFVGVNYVGLSAILWAVTTVTSAICFGCAGEKTFTRNWLSTSFGSYYKPIPAFVLQTAVDIKTRMPEAHMEIEYLKIENVVREDPFLTLRLPNGDEPAQILYLEVWDEPTFNAKRLEVRDVVK